MKVSKKTLLLLGCLVLLSSFNPLIEAQAQETGPWAYLSPDNAYIYINGTNQVAVDVMVRDVENINSFDVKVSFDPTKVNIVSYEFGDFFQAMICSNEFVEETYIRLVCTQMAQPGQYGTGSLFRIYFGGVAEGTTPLTLDRANLGTKDNKYVYPGLTSGTLNVVNTGNFIYLPLIMNVSVQGALDRGGIDVALGRGLNYGMGPYSGTSLDEVGNNLTIPGVVADSYRISTNHPRVLNITPEMNKFYTLASEADPVPALKLVAGNAFWEDNEIKLSDWTVVCGALGDVTLNEDADVNFDGSVDARDLALVAGNWGLNSGTAYAAWLP